MLFYHFIYQQPQECALERFLHCFFIFYFGKYKCLKRLDGLKAVGKRAKAKLSLGFYCEREQVHAHEE